MAQIPEIERKLQALREAFGDNNMDGLLQLAKLLQTPAVSNIQEQEPSYIPSPAIPSLQPSRYNVAPRADSEIVAKEEANLSPAPPFFSLQPSLYTIVRQGSTSSMMNPVSILPASIMSSPTSSPTPAIPTANPAQVLDMTQSASQIDQGGSFDSQATPGTQSEIVTILTEESLSDVMLSSGSASSSNANQHDAQESEADHDPAEADLKSLLKEEGLENYFELLKNVHGITTKEKFRFMHDSDIDIFCNVIEHRISFRRILKQLVTDNFLVLNYVEFYSIFFFRKSRTSA